MKRLATTFVALLILALSATAVMASHATLATDRSTAQLGQVPSDSAEPSESPEATETPEATEPGDVSPHAAASPQAAHPENHGAVVSAAAQGPVPAGFPNRGAYVSSIARQGHGKPGGPGHGGAPPR